MLKFPYRNFLERFEYNQNMLAEDLSRRMQEYDRLSSRSERAERFRLPVADRTVGEAIRNILKNSIEKQKEKLDEGWRQVYGAKYPSICDHAGEYRDAYAVKEELTSFPESRDGWYHIPDIMCASKTEKDAAKRLEKECEKTGKRIPYAVGKQLENIFQNAQADHRQIWVHRTGLSIDGGDLASIAKHGLIVPAQGHSADELPELGYTATKIPMTTNGFLFLLQTAALDEYKQMRGAVICMTDENPNISHGHLEPGQVVGYVARDQNGHVCKMLDLKEMSQCHNTKTILLDNREIEIDRKSNADLKQRDYCKCHVAGIGELYLVNDAYDGNVKNCSITYDGHIYGNLSAFAAAEHITFDQAKEVRNHILQFDDDLKASWADASDGANERDALLPEEEYDRQAMLSGHTLGESGPSMLDELNAETSESYDQYENKSMRGVVDEPER